MHISRHASVDGMNGVSMRVERGDCIFVSGGSGGIGKNVCSKLADKGFIPLIGYHNNEHDAKQLATELGGHAIHFAPNVLNEDKPPIEPLDLLNLKVGGVILAASPPLRIAPLRQTSIQDMRSQWNVNVLGHWQLCQHLIDHYMKANRRGVVVGILSKAMGDEHTKAAPHMAAYIIAKYGLLGLMRSLETEYPWLRTTTVSLGYTETSMLDAFDPRFLDLMRDKTPDKKFADPEIVAAQIINALVTT